MFRLMTGHRQIKKTVRSNGLSFTVLLVVNTKTLNMTLNTYYIWGGVHRHWQVAFFLSPLSPFFSWRPLPSVFTSLSHHFIVTFYHGWKKFFKRVEKQKPSLGWTHQFSMARGQGHCDLASYPVLWSQERSGEPGRSFHSDLKSHFLIGWRGRKSSTSLWPIEMVGGSLSRYF